MLFTVCQNSIGKYDFGSVALCAPPPGVLQVAKSPVLLGFSKFISKKTDKYTVCIFFLLKYELLIYPDG